MGTPRTLADLSPRHRQVALLLAEGLSHKKIALRLCLTRGTVRQYINRIADRLPDEKLPASERVIVWVRTHEELR